MPNTGGAQQLSQGCKVNPGALPELSNVNVNTHVCTHFQRLESNSNALLANGSRISALTRTDIKHRYQCSIWCRTLEVRCALLQLVWQLQQSGLMLSLLAFLIQERACCNSTGYMTCSLLAQKADTISSAGQGH